MQMSSVHQAVEYEKDHSALTEWILSFLPSYSCSIRLKVEWMASLGPHLPSVVGGEATQWNVTWSGCPCFRKEWLGGKWVAVQATGAAPTRRCHAGSTTAKLSSSARSRPPRGIDKYSGRRKAAAAFCLAAPMIAREAAESCWVRDCCMPSDPTSCPLAATGEGYARTS